MSQTLNLISDEQYAVFEATIPYTITVNYDDNTQFVHSATIEETVGNFIITNDALYLVGPSANPIATVVIGATTYDFNDPDTIASVEMVGCEVSEVDKSLGSLILHQEGEFQ